MIGPINPEKTRLLISLKMTRKMNLILKGHGDILLQAKRSTMIMIIRDDEKAVNV